MRLNVSQNGRIIRLRRITRQDKPETHKRDELNKHFVTSRRKVCGGVAINWRQSKQTNFMFICTAVLFRVF